MIEVEVLFFARARELAGVPSSRLELPPGSTVALASGRLAERFPQLRGLLERCRFALDEEFARLEDSIGERSTLAVIPPVSGG